jgi:long-chain fatty acid transport protein
MFKGDSGNRGEGQKMNNKTIQIAILALVSSSSLAMAGGFAIREQSTIGQGTSFAGVAAGGGGLSSLFWNPAVSAEYNEFGFISENNAALILPQSESDLPAPGSGNIGEMAVVPAGYFSYALTDQITIASSVNSPLGLTTNANDNWPGAALGDKSGVRTYNWNPSVSYKLSDMISVGVGAQVEYMSVELTNRVGGVQVFSAEGGDFGFGFTAGVLFEPTETTDIGIGFRSSVKHKLEGDALIGALNPDIIAKFTAPELVTVGVRQQVSDQLTLMAGVEWANWSRLKNLTIENAAGGVITSQPFAWKDSWYFSVGAEYAYSDDFTLRAGAAYEKSPVPDATRGVRIPDNDRTWLSVGASYKFAEGWTGNFAYSHVFIKDGPVAGTPINFEQSLDIVSIGLTRDW